MTSYSRKNGSRWWKYLGTKFCAANLQTNRLSLHHEELLFFRLLCSFYDTKFCNKFVFIAQIFSPLLLGGDQIRAHLYRKSDLFYLPFFSSLARPLGIFCVLFIVTDWTFCPFLWNLRHSTGYRSKFCIFFSNYHFLSLLLVCRRWKRVNSGSGNFYFIHPQDVHIKISKREFFRWKAKNCSIFFFFLLILIFLSVFFRIRCSVYLEVVEWYIRSN